MSDRDTGAPSGEGTPTPAAPLWGEHKYAFIPLAEEWENPYCIFSSDVIVSFTVTETNWSKKEVKSAEHYTQYRKALILQKHECPKVAGARDARARLITFDVDELPNKVDASAMFPDQIRALTDGFDLEAVPEAAAEWSDAIKEVLWRGTWYKFAGQSCPGRAEMWREVLTDEASDKFIVEACCRGCPCSYGVGYPADQALDNRTRWKENLLGKTLMSVRDHLKRWPHHEAVFWMDRKAEEAEGLDDGRA